jgi:ubiquinone/menaquinone biosynthesis C-methylase UbiE
MDHRWILPVPEYYARFNAYVTEFGIPHAAADYQQWDQEAPLLRNALGEAQGRLVLDCSCGWGRQAIALAKLGWQVTACDVSETSLDFARQFAIQEKVQLDFRVMDMRELSPSFNQHYDWVVSCFALYEIPTDEGILRALQAMFTALKPGGSCYMRFRDMDFLMEEQPRHVFCGEKRVPNGRIVCIEDWDFESETQVAAMTAYLREDERLDPSDHFRWVTETIGCRKRVMRKADLQRLLLAAGFTQVTFLPQPAPWFPFEVVASRPIS